jgi:hypothetical protein
MFVCRAYRRFAARTVDVLNIALAYVLHHLRNTAYGFRRHRQMHVIGHQHIGMDSNRFRRGQLRVFVQKLTIALVREEDCRPVDATQYRVHRIFRGNNSGASRHQSIPVERLERQARRANEVCPCFSARRSSPTTTPSII